MTGNKLKLKFYINANHAIIFDSINISSIHGHTWEIITTFVEKDLELNKFHVLEKRIVEYLDNYKEKVLNDVYPFNKINPTMENIGLVVFEDIDKLMQDSSYALECVEVLENPTRTYAVYSAVNYKELEDSKYEMTMRRELNKARGIEEAEEISAPNDELSKTLKSITKSLRAIEVTQSRLLKTEKSRKRNQRFLFALVGVITGALVGLDYLGYIDVLSLFYEVLGG